MWRSVSAGSSCASRLDAVRGELRGRGRGETCGPFFIMSALQIILSVIGLRLLIWALKKGFHAFNRMSLVALCFFAFALSASAQEPDPTPEPEPEPEPVVEVWDADKWQIFGIAFLCGGLLWSRVERFLRV